MKSSPNPYSIIDLDLIDQIIAKHLGNGWSMLKRVESVEDVITSFIVVLHRESDNFLISSQDIAHIANDRTEEEFELDLLYVCIDLIKYKVEADRMAMEITSRKD